jgi:polyhydroxybutyrate depolymerase
VAQRAGDVPALTPDPVHASHASSRETSTSLEHPKTASAKSIVRSCRSSAPGCGRRARAAPPLPPPIPPKPPPLAFLLLNGTANPLIPYQGGPIRLRGVKGEVVSAEATLAPFAAANACSTQRSSHDYPDRDLDDGSRVTMERLSGCKHMVELVRVEGGGHTLPGRPTRADRGQSVGALNRDVNASRLILEFIRRSER